MPQFAENIFNIKNRQKRRKLRKELQEALVFSLVNAPAATITIMQPIDSRIKEVGNDFDPFVDLGSLVVCSAPLLLSYDKDSIMRYYHTLSARLKQIGKVGEPCLKTLNSSMEYILARDARGKINWSGTKNWQPSSE